MPLYRDDKTEEFLAMAQELERQAKGITDTDIKKSLLRLADSYRDLAAQRKHKSN